MFIPIVPEILFSVILMALGNNETTRQTNGIPPARIVPGILTEIIRTAPGLQHDNKISIVVPPEAGCEVAEVE